MAFTKTVRFSKGIVRFSREQPAGSPGRAPLLKPVREPGGPAEILLHQQQGEAPLLELPNGRADLPDDDRR
jgi:hypothetical protein